MKKSFVVLFIILFFTGCSNLFNTTSNVSFNTTLHPLSGGDSRATLPTVSTDESLSSVEKIQLWISDENVDYWLLEPAVDGIVPQVEEVTDAAESLVAGDETSIVDLATDALDTIGATKRATETDETESTEESDEPSIIYYFESTTSTIEAPAVRTDIPRVFTIRVEFLHEDINRVFIGTTTRTLVPSDTTIAIDLYETSSSKNNVKLSELNNL